MSMRFTIDPKGLAYMLREASNATEQIAEDILADAKSLAPVDTGELRGSGDVDGGGKDFTVRFTAPYAAFVELGTSRAPARPFLTPAALKRRTR